MKQCIKSWKTGETIYNGKHKTMQDAVEHCVKNNICLNYASLNGASLNWASLDGASLNGASLNGASLNWASLKWASLERASLKWASLDGASLEMALLNGALLNGASLNGASYNHLTIGITMVCPATGSYECWKKCDDGVLVKLLVPAAAKRSSATTRKCRAEFVDVLDGEGKTEYKGHITYYKKGERVYPFNGFDENRWNECAAGIHHFVNKEDAERWDY
jgi:uncharacterized protein YjbI with pentapeptide repeats